MTSGESSRAATASADLTGSEIELEVGKVATGGSCVARLDNRVVFVRHALPGERVRARVTEESKRYLRADAVEILEASADRVDPPCPFAGPGRCGGCDWQHASPAAQRRFKAAVVEEQLLRLAGLERQVTVEEFPSAVVTGWRTRMQFAVRRDGAVGLRRHRSHEIEPIDECLIAHPEVEALGVPRKRWPAAASVAVDVSAATGDRLVTVKGRRPRVPRLDAPVRVVHGDPVPGPGLPYVREEAAGRMWQVSGGGFWQVHPDAAEVLAAAVLDALRPRTGSTALDLYCGAGLFAGVLGQAVGRRGRVTGIESDPQAVHDARHNLRDLRQVTIERGQVEKILGQMQGEVDVTVLDPPRAGAERVVVERIADLTRRKIAYVSCDPATLARDLARFGERGWTLESLRAFDAFPMTHHVECLAVLVKG